MLASFWLTSSHKLHEQGVAPADIVKETSSYDTVGNAYFAATIHCIPAGWRHELQTLPCMIAANTDPSTFAADMLST